MLDQLTWAKEVGVSGARLGDAGEEWLVRLYKALEELDPSGVKVGSVLTDATTGPFIVLGLYRDGIRIDTVALLTEISGATAVLAAGSVSPDETVIELLSAAVKRVDETLGTEGESFAWAAVIGPSADRIGGQEIHLAAPGQVGGMSLKSSDIKYREIQRSEHSMGGGSLLVSIPIIVSGSSIGYAWNSASLLAARDLHTLCGMLSLRFGQPISVRQAARPLEHGEPHVPESEVGTPEFPFPEMDGPVENAVELPEWFELGWERTQLPNTKCRRALDAFLEGEYIERRHPSMAAVAYTACIEVFSDGLAPRPRCQECGVQTGISKNFKLALRLVLDEQEAAALDRIYTLRSKTVHTGHIHGSEVIPGANPFDYFLDSTSEAFENRPLRQLKRVAGELLRRALQDGPDSIKLEGAI
ncbi:hypothetical protein [Aeromicrobium sp.]|uniref:hypothetical protein n=1 Tax=Aeromicrobium sp. TaxID=1871063 RepID=UPI002FC59B38